MESLNVVFTSNLQGLEYYSQFNIGTYLGHDDLNTTNKCYIHLTNEIHEPINKEDFINNILF